MNSTVTITNLQQALLVALTNVLTRIISFVPTFAFALIIIFVGFIVARWAKWLTIQIVKSFKISKILKKTPLEKFLHKAEVSSKIEDLFGTLARWLVLLVFFIAAINLLGLTTVSSFLDNILAYIPSVISAALILTLGTIVAGLIESFIKGSLTGIKRKTARLISKIASYTIIIFTILAAFAELKIAQNLITILIIGFVTTLSLGLGLAFGLGAKDLVARILDDWYDDFKRENK